MAALVTVNPTRAPARADHLQVCLSCPESFPNVLPKLQAIQDLCWLDASQVNKPELQCQTVQGRWAAAMVDQRE